MDTGFAIYIIQSAIFQILLMAAPLLIIGMAVGLIVSIFQATTSIQEQTLTFVPKIAAILLALVLFGPWIVNQMVEFARTIISYIPEMLK